MKKILIALTTIILIQNVHAGEIYGTKEKSIGIALALGIDPIPGDALFYAGYNGQGTVNMIFGTLGGALFWAGFAGLQSSCSPGEEMCHMGSAIAAFSGGLIYFPMLIWDLIGGATGVSAQNKQVAKAHTWLQTVQPTLAVNENGAMAGVQIHF